MPYKIVKENDKFNVINAGNKKLKGSHATKAEAVDQMRALYATINGARKHATMDVLLKSIMAHEAGKGNHDNRVLNMVLGQLIPEIGSQDSIIETPIIFQQPTNTDFLQEGLQKNLVRAIAEQEYLAAN